MTEQLLNPKNIAEKLNVAKSTVYALLRKGELPIIQIGKCIRVRPEDLENYINQQKRL